MDSALAGFACAVMDFDYTVVDLFDAVDLFGLRTELRKVLKGHGFRVEGMRTLPVGLLKHAIEHYEGSEGERESRWEEASRLLCRYESDAAPRAVMPPDTVPFLKQLRSAGLRTAIVSSNCEHAIELALEHLEIAGYFDCVVGRNSVKWEMKPSPLGVELALKQLGVEAGKAFGIGDSAVDIISFERAGVFPMGITGGISTGGELRESGAKAVVSRLSEVAGALHQATRYTSSASES